MTTNPDSGAETRKSILMIDDDTSSLMVLRSALRDLASLRFATTADEGLFMARSQPPDLILLDAEMPGRNGLHALGEIRADPVLSPVPVVIVTAHTGVDFEVLTLEQGADDFLRKPLHFDLLRTRVSRLLFGRRAVSAI